MRKQLFFLPLMAALTLTACSSDDEPATDNPAEGDYTTHYMSVNIVSADDASGRSNTEYEDGTETENKVTSIRFFFFTENGEPANVKISPSGSSYQSYYDWTPSEGSQLPSDDATNHVESIISATIVINTKEGDKLPRTMVAVLNPTDNLKQKGANRLDVLRAFSNDYAQEGLTQMGKFVMTNSVYVTGTPTTEVCPVYIQNSNICDSKEKAMAAPVTIYVERNVAKVKVQLKEGLFDSDGKMALKDKDGNAISVVSEPVYLKLYNWALTSETDKGLLIKKINTEWISQWWKDGQFRCTWAINSADANNKWVPSYSSISKNFGTADYQYTNENAANYSTGTSSKDVEKTKFIVKGKLVKGDGTPVTLVRHLGQLFADTYSITESDNLPLLKKSILNYLRTENLYYWKALSDGSGRQEISETDIVIKANTTIQKEESKNNCYVHAELTADALAATWYTSETGDETVAASSINDKLKNKETMGEALVWREGQTYYYSKIVHRNDDTGSDATYGVVRNHVYKVNIANITGLGTPVYDPGLVIYPEKPEQDDHYIAAAIDILSWRIVSYDYTLDW